MEDMRVVMKADKLVDLTVTLMDVTRVDKMVEL
jgi:hypothetical protein